MSTDLSSQDSKRKKGSQPGRVEHPKEAERVAVGKAVRGEVPRSAHAAWEPSRDRPSPVALLEEQAETRVPELVPIRYGRMLVLAVHVLPWCRLPDGLRPLGHAEDQSQRAVVR